MDEFTDLQVHIFPRRSTDGRYPVTVSVDGADPVTELLHLDLSALPAAELTLDPAIYGMDRNSARPVRRKSQGNLPAAIEHLQPAADFCVKIGHPLGAQLLAKIEQWQAALDNSES